MLPLGHGTDQISCGYTSLLATGADTFLVIYSDFNYRTPAGQIRKAIKTREVRVTSRPPPSRQLKAPKLSGGEGRLLE
jgi:hypothetical protein